MHSNLLTPFIFQLEQENVNKEDPITDSSPFSEDIPTDQNPSLFKDSDMPTIESGITDNEKNNKYPAKPDVDVPELSLEEVCLHDLSDSSHVQTDVTNTVDACSKYFVDKDSTDMPHEEPSPQNSSDFYPESLVTTKPAELDSEFVPLDTVDWSPTEAVSSLEDISQNVYSSQLGSHSEDTYLPSLETAQRDDGELFHRDPSHKHTDDMSPTELCPEGTEDQFPVDSSDNSASLFPAVSGSMETSHDPLAETVIKDIELQTVESKLEDTAEMIPVATMDMSPVQLSHDIAEMSATNIEPCHDIAEVSPTDIEPGHKDIAEMSPTDIEPGHKDIPEMSPTDIEPGRKDIAEMSPTSVEPGYKDFADVSLTGVEPGYKDFADVSLTGIEPGYRDFGDVSLTGIEPGYKDFVDVSPVEKSPTDIDMSHIQPGPKNIDDLFTLEPDPVMSPVQSSPENIVTSLLEPVPADVADMSSRETGLRNIADVSPTELGPGDIGDMSPMEPGPEDIGDMSPVEPEPNAITKMCSMEPGSKDTAHDMYQIENNLQSTAPLSFEESCHGLSLDMVDVLQEQPVEMSPTGATSEDKFDESLVPPDQLKTLDSWPNDSSSQNVSSVEPENTEASSVSPDVSGSGRDAYDQYPDEFTTKDMMGVSSIEYSNVDPDLILVDSPSDNSPLQPGAFEPAADVSPAEAKSPFVEGSTFETGVPSDKDSFAQ